MQNRNALVSLACASQSSDPFAVFQEYIKYCLHNHSQSSMLVSELIESVQSEFGIKLPHNIAIVCIDKLESLGLAEVKEYKIFKNGVFDLSGFIARRDEYRKIESSLLTHLIEYAGNYHKHWDEEYARKMLVRVLDREGLAFDIFFMQNALEADKLNSTTEDGEYEWLNNAASSTAIETPLYSDEFIVGEYVHNLLNKDSIYKDYLIKICSGITLCAGIYQLPSSGSELVRPFIKNTIFFFDTRLLLRFVGCGTIALVESAKEVIELIQKYGGKICYYSLTKEEMFSAFDNAVSQLKNGSYIVDFEMRCFAQKHKDNASVISAKKASLVAELASKDIFERELENDPCVTDTRIGFNLSDLRQYMYSNVNWKNRTIDNDARVVWETHMRRKGNYSDYYGTSKQLSVFVTSNRELMMLLNRYRKDRSDVIGITGWSNARLPVITDARLMCRLWSPADNANNMPLLYMVSSVAAAQRFTPEYLSKICELANEFKTAVPEYANIPLSSFFDDEFTDAVLLQTEGKKEKLTIELLASSIDELTSRKAREEAELRMQAEAKVQEVQTMFEAQGDQLVKDAIESYKSEIRLQEHCARLMLNGTRIIAILLAIISAVIGVLFQNWWMLFPTVGLLVAEKLFDTCSSKWLVRKILPKIKKSCKNKIHKLLRDSEKTYESIIIEGVFAESKVLSQCQRLINEE